MATKIAVTQKLDQSRNSSTATKNSIVSGNPVVGQQCQTSRTSSWDASCGGGWL